ncbi:putative ribonuclease-like protein YfkH [Halobacillus andaensis]|uniref:Ribonuclease-like protein YfkH n=1 Tax=Halobacillus andaensis TaxID=1176239 RepID=A0A917EVS4_HALAA|nr:YihY/virulence factor BrkB family protein [Halobacillus andaensis]MBP2004752.1 membrane protein [Halobacillus andaensis]GGF19214.1 putative ribonuclease-like protein YfkH [Halobacillus andaensis]
MKKIINYGKEVFAEFQKDNVPLLGAAQAFYYLLAIFPLVILLLSILPYLNISAEDAMGFVQNVVPGQASDIFEENIVELVEQPNGGLLTVGILGTLWSASSGVNAFIQASNIAYNVEESRSFIKVRLLSIILTIGMIVSIAVALALPIFGDVIISTLREVLNLPEQTVILFQVLRWAVSIIVMAGTLMALYHFAPDKTFPFKEILPGAIITAVLWQVVSLIFSFYVSNFANYSATYGSLGGIIILMLWFFITGMILMIGAEINVVRHRRKKREAREVA